MFPFGRYELGGGDRVCRAIGAHISRQSRLLIGPVVITRSCISTTRTAASPRRRNSSTSGTSPGAAISLFDAARPMNVWSWMGRRSVRVPPRHYNWRRMVFSGVCFGDFDHGWQCAEPRLHGSALLRFSTRCPRCSGPYSGKLDMAMTRRPVQTYLPDGAFVPNVSGTSSQRALRALPSGGGISVEVLLVAQVGKRRNDCVAAYGQ